MPKLKTHSGAKKRLKVTKNGKVIRAHANMSHLLNGHGKTAKTKRHARGTTTTDKTSLNAVKKLLPYAY
ncbi:MAG: 50S ribosomal protein L35 [Ruminococcaceae bacterium]|nr:50S ribosomal protein L35 [Oscillospiraceae bacterium]